MTNNQNVWSRSCSCVLSVCMLFILDGMIDLSILTVLYRLLRFVFVMKLWNMDTLLWFFPLLLYLFCATFIFLSLYYVVVDETTPKEHPFRLSKWSGAEAGWSTVVQGKVGVLFKRSAWGRGKLASRRWHSLVLFAKKQLEAYCFCQIHKWRKLLQGEMKSLL